MESSRPPVSRIYYPICLKVRNRRCLIVGGGRVAAAKAAALADAGASVSVVATRVCGRLSGLSGADVTLRAYAPGDEAGSSLVIAATDDPAVNRLVSQRCREAGIWCCVVDDPDAGDFVVPATMRRGDLAVSVSTGGAAPALSKRLRRELERAFPEEYAGYVEFLRETRQRAMREVGDEARRRDVAAYLASRQGFERYRAMDDAERGRWALELLGLRDDGSAGGVE